MKKQLLTLMILPLIASCGFEPMHGTAFKGDNAQSAHIKSELEQIEIANIPDREGQFLRNALIDSFYRDGRPINPSYVLEVKPIVENTYDLDITIRSDATRQQLTLNTEMAFKNKVSGEVLLVRDLKSSGSFNVLASEFATRVSEQNTRENALKDLARQIELQIALYLKRGE